MADNLVGTRHYRADAIVGTKLGPLFDYNRICPQCDGRTLEGAFDGFIDVITCASCVERRANIIENSRLANLRTATRSAKRSKAKRAAASKQVAELSESMHGAI